MGANQNPNFHSLSFNMKNFVMFGQNPLFGDYADLIDALGGRISRVVVNVPDPPREDQKSFADRLAEYNAWLAAERGEPTPVEVIDLDDFEADPEETAVMGFRGVSSRPLRQRLKQEFGITFPALIHPTAWVSPMAEIGEGTIICSLADVGSFAKIGAFGVINRCASMGHDTVAGDDVDMSTKRDTGIEYQSRGWRAPRAQLLGDRAPDPRRVLLRRCRCGGDPRCPAREARGRRTGSGQEGARVVRLMRIEVYQRGTASRTVGGICRAACAQRPLHAHAPLPRLPRGPLR